MIDQSIFENSIDFTGVKVLLYINEKHAIFEQRDGRASFFPYKIDLIGGKRDTGESPLETLIREVFEETHIKITNADIVHSELRQSFVDPSKSTYFFVVKANTSPDLIKYGNEGLGLVILDPYIFIDLDNGVTPRQTMVREYLNQTVI